MEMDDLDRRLLKEIQDSLPISPTPYAAIAAALSIGEDEALRRLQALRENRIIRQINAIFDTRALGYQSSLVASRLSPERLLEGAQIINSHPGVTHNYERNDDFNLWWTVAVPPDGSLEATVQRLHELSGAESTRILPTLKLFKIGVNLDITGDRAADATSAPEYTEDDRARSHAHTLTERDKQLVRALQDELAITPRPFDAPAASVGLDADQLLQEALRLQEQGYLRRFAAILYHRRAGFRANAMGVWAVPSEKVAAIGPRMAAFTSVSHCYQRPTYPDWPFSIFTMVHARTPDECGEILAAISRTTGIDEYRALYSTREWKKTRVRYFTPDIQEWERQYMPATATA
jgi:DNA-binding Lrp family transcriptional regulator